MSETASIDHSTIESLRTAADQAHARYDHAAAVALCTEAIDLARSSLHPSSFILHPFLFDLLSRRAEAYGYLADTSAWLADLVEMQRLAEAADDQPRLARAL